MIKKTVVFEADGDFTNSEFTMEEYISKMNELMHDPDNNPGFAIQLDLTEKFGTIRRITSATFVFKSARIELEEVPDDPAKSKGLFSGIFGC